MICLGALLAGIRQKRPVEAAGPTLEADGEEEDPARYPNATALAVCASLIFVGTLTALGAIVASAVFLFILLTYLNRKKWLVNVSITVLVPVAMYSLFSVGLNAELPSGIIPW